MAPAATITPDNHGAYVTVVSTILLAWMVCFTFIRVLIRYRYTGPWAGDDYATMVAAFLGIGQTAATYSSIHNGFGTREKLLSQEQLLAVEKAMYGSSILYLFAMCAAKVATLILLSRLTRVRKHNLATYCTIACTCLWGLVSVFLVSLIGNFSHPWTSVFGGFPDLWPRWIGIAVVGMVIEIAIFALAIGLVWDLHMAFNVKATVVVAFSFRLLTIVPSATRLHYLNPSFAASDPTYLGIYAAMLMQVDVQYSIIAATIPCLRPFIRPFDPQLLDYEMDDGNDKSGDSASSNDASGIISGTERSQSTQASHSTRRSGQSVLRSLGSSVRQKKNKREDTLHSEITKEERELWLSGKKEGLRPANCQVTTVIQHEPDAARPESLSSDQLVIKQTRKWEVTYDSKSQ